MQSVGGREQHLAEEERGRGHPVRVEVAVQRGVPRGEGLPRLARLAPSLACSRARVLLTAQCPVLLSTCVGRAGAGEGPLPVPGVRQLLGGGGAEQLLALLPLDLVHHLRQTLQDRTISNGYFSI